MPDAAEWCHRMPSWQVDRQALGKPGLTDRLVVMYRTLACIIHGDSAFRGNRAEQVHLCQRRSFAIQLPSVAQRVWWARSRAWTEAANARHGCHTQVE